MLTVTAPDPLNGATLRDELAAAGITVDRDNVRKAGDNLHFATLDEDARPTVEQVVADHTGEPSPDPQAEARQRFRDAVQAAQAKGAAATSVAALRGAFADLTDALLGTGTNAEPDVRPGPPQS